MAGEEPRAPGWYPDPWGGEGERYYDGKSWSRDNVAALPDPFATRSRSWIGWIIGGVVAIAAVVAIAVVALSASGGSSPAATPSKTASSLGASTTTTTNASVQLPEYDAGDCATWDQSVDDTPAHLVSCSKPHLIELVAPRHVPASYRDYPTAPQWDLIDASVCAPVVESYLHTKLDPAGQYVASSIFPSPIGWVHGDRNLACGIIKRGSSPGITLVPFTGSADASKQSEVLAPGSCLPAAGGGLSTGPVPCTQPHLVEVSGAVDLRGRMDHAPTDDEMRATILGDCDRIAATYLGHPLDGNLAAGWLDIDPGSWAAGRRIAECTVGRYDGNDAPVTLNASLRAG
jgi:hypothetical protein